MAQSAKPYHAAVRAALSSALCLRNFPSQTVERHNRPEVEDRGSKELLLPAVTIPRSGGEGGVAASREAVLIEPSINAVRVSLRIKQADELERLLVRQFAAFLQQRAEAFGVLRRRPVPGWDLSFLITHAHTEAVPTERLVDFVLRFMEDIDREVSAMKIGLSARSRLVGGAWLDALAKGDAPQQQAQR